MNTPFPVATTDQTNEFQQYKQIPADLILYGVITNTRFKEYTKSAKSSHPNRRGQIWGLTFQVLGGDFNGQKVFDDIFMDIEWYEDMGVWSCLPYGGITKGVKLMAALGYEVETLESGELRTGWLPPHETYFDQLCGGVGIYIDKNPLLGTLIGIKTGLKNRKKREKVDGEWQDVMGDDGKVVTDKVTFMADIFPAPATIVVELAQQVAAYHAKNVAEAPAAATDDDLPF